MTKSMKSMSGSEKNEIIESGTAMDCKDCIFWYRCKHGGIDCERKER